MFSPLWGRKNILSANRTNKRVYRYGFGCEIHSQQKIYLSDTEMYICGVPKWEVTLQKKKIDRRNAEVFIVEEI